jgi:hypothetical protein
MNSRESRPKSWKIRRPSRDLRSGGKKRHQGAAGQSPFSLSVVGSWHLRNALFHNTHTLPLHAQFTIYSKAPCAYNFGRTKKPPARPNSGNILPIICGAQAQAEARLCAKHEQCVKKRSHLGNHLRVGLYFVCHGGT